MLDDYNMWMAAPGSITERRKRLLQGMGISSNKDLLKLASAKILKAVSRKVETYQVPITSKVESVPPEEPKQEPSASTSTPVLLVRSRSDGDIDPFSAFTKQRKEELIGTISKQRLTRTSSVISTPHIGVIPHAKSVRLPSNSERKKPNNSASMFSDGGLGSFFLIKNLDTGKEFIVKEFNEEGMWNKLSDLQTGKQLTMEEFEKSVGHSPVVKELMRRANVSRESLEDVRKVSTNSYLSKSFRYSKKRGVAFLKNIKGVANSMSGLMIEKERDNNSSTADQQPNKNSSSQWVKVRQQGKSYKEFTALHMCQEIQAHEGTIWAIKFSLDGHYLASAGEDRVIHVWEVQECEVMSMRPPDDLNFAGITPLHPMACSSPDRFPLAELKSMPSERRKRGKTSTRKKGNSIPDYVQVPETAFALSEQPVCTFQGHQDDVLDLSWSRSQLLLSSSMDKTVRLWDKETKSCLKLFAHNDYVTCIQFNPMDDDYFISGSLDAKVRIWNIPNRQVVDWTDLHEMVTAASYTPDGQGALIGTHKGSCCFYSIADCKIKQKDHIETQNKKKSQGRKITGFEFSPCNPFEVLITSADSSVKIFDGLDIIQKFRGFRNTNSQISASFSPDGKYVISASEDSQVYIWKREDTRNAATGKAKSSMITTQSHEHFQCREVSVAIPWPGSAKYEPPVVEVHSKRHSKRCTPPPHSASESPTGDDILVGPNSKRHLPPLPKKNNNLERTTSCLDEDFANSSRTDSGICISESLSASIRYDDSPSISAFGSSPSQSWTSSRSLFDGGNAVQATAWGLVIVTAGLGGEIRVYQNFGLPLKVGRQTNLFKELTQ